MLDDDSSIHTIRGNADRITYTAKSKSKVFVLQDYHSPIGIVDQTSTEDDRHCMAVEVMRIIRNVVRPKNTLAKLKELE
jgi:hypothetical protein